MTAGALMEATRAGRAIRASSRSRATNVAKLHVAWTYHTGALKPQTELNEKAAFEATPILVDGTLYLSTPFNQVIALDPATGAERWIFDPKVNRSHDYSEVSSRGVACWPMRVRPMARPASCAFSKAPSTHGSSHWTARPASRARVLDPAGAVDLTRGVEYWPEFRGVLPGHLRAHRRGRSGDHRLIDRR